MFQPLDVFQTDSDGSVLWRGAVEDFAAAKRQIERLGLSAPGEYLIVNQETQQRLRITVPSRDKSAQASAQKGDAQYVEMRLTSLVI